ncbi:MAG: phosphosulfolactate synthase [Candidatus Reconcilbacillus cellulovorans]|uniref:Phosphosulfolactate synthase n=1 Tax=Candidatus Reconcilbacillus cellulovorans TaxID=1906605 RepID=A0A2A6E144_9BACL|nr:MAG: phosphosulfolactate synthase [Candidatus Reconcilbacillus cellulovorans]
MESYRKPSVWPPSMADPSGVREKRPRTAGKTMVIDKGLGPYAFFDLLQVGGSHIDYIKLGFGSAPLYPVSVLKQKIDLARRRNIRILPGGTFLEAAVAQREVDEFFRIVKRLGFTALEVSDGTIDMSRRLRSELILRGLELGFEVLTEYGKKRKGSRVDLTELCETAETDLELGASLVAIEGRECGADVGIYREDGACREDAVREIAERFSRPDRLLWEAPRKEQQAWLLRELGPDIHIGNVAPQDVLSLESLRRGLRADTFLHGMKSLART